MPAKAKTRETPKTKSKTQAASKPKADVKAETAQDAKEANRARQHRFQEKHRDEINEKRRQRYAERKEEGRCPRCGKKLRSKKHTLCKDCLERAKKYNGESTTPPQAAY